MALINPQEMTGIIDSGKTRKAIIKKHPKETVTQLYERAEKRGIGRECVSCSAKRRFAMLQCPVCLSFMHHQVEYRSPSDPVQGEGREPESPRNQSHTDGGYNFEGNPDFDPTTGVSPSSDTRPLGDRNLVELQVYAIQQEISLPESLLKKNASKADVRSYIEDKLGGIPAVASPDVPIQDQEGLDASNNQLKNANE